MALGDIVQKEQQWMDRANCIGNAEPFDNYDRDIEAAKEADAMCLGCPVIKECFEMGKRGQYGQWGGIFWNFTGEPDLRANAHKSEEYMEEVERKVT